MPIFEFKYRPNASLPRLAWCARVPRGGGDVIVEHGEWVECRSSFFVEGAWNGRFEDGRVGETELLLGSGGRLDAVDVVFAPTTHTMERLHSVRIADALYLSNSFCYLLSVIDDRPDVRYRWYEDDFGTYQDGYLEARAPVPTAGGRSIQLHYHNMLRVDAALSITTEAPPEPTGFHDYDGYRTSVTELLRHVVENAQAAQRHVRYELLSTISTGYDSPACSVIARAVGCRRAATFRDARREYNPWIVNSVDDSGAAIAKYLGLEVIERSREDYKRCGEFPEAEFLATGNGGDEVIFKPLEDELTGAIFITGFAGNAMWDITGTDPEQARVYKLPKLRGGNMTELRLRVGFVHAPLPIFTIARVAELQAVSASPEMAPWRIGGNYDRPVARRLVESEGVPRDIYAQEKKAVSQPLWFAPAIEEQLIPSSLADLRGFVRNAKKELPWGETMRSLQARQTLAARRLPNRWKKWGRKLARKSGIAAFDVHAQSLLRLRLQVSRTNGLKFHWAVARTLNRYRATEIGIGAHSSPIASASRGTPA
jgi:hypothetical protein